jgi:membrane fusion protein, multidrug efflux system
MIKKEKTRRVLFIGGGIVFAVVILFLYCTSGRYISTDDAYIKAARVDVSSNIDGRVQKVFVKENQYVKKGTPLFTLDDRMEHIALEKAQANLQAQRSRIKALEATYKQASAFIVSSQAAFTFYKQNLERQKQLAAHKIASQATLEDAQRKFIKAKQDLIEAQYKRQNIFASLDGSVTMPIDAHPTVQEAIAEVKKARLNLSYTHIDAPLSGIVAKVDTLQRGTYIKKAEPLFAIISQKNVWI